MFMLQVSVLRRLWLEEDAQDLIEYALLTGAIGFAGVVGVSLIGAAINAVYSSWDTGVNTLWEVPDPL
jgi:Flp pilus assembly pilin Flp